VSRSTPFCRHANDNGSSIAVVLNTFRSRRWLNYYENLQICV